jgi:DNA-binding transcriptional LysR family regulator
MADPTLDDLRLLAAFSEGASLRTVAASLALDKSKLSRELLRLEDRLGESLFLRRGRALRLTRIGALVVARAREVIAGVEDVSALLGDAGDRPLVVSAAPLLSELLLPAALTVVRAKHPSVRIAVQLSHEYRELFDERIDVAIRRGPLEDSDSLQARRLGDSTMVVVAHPALGAASPPLEAGLLSQPWIRVGPTPEPIRVKLAGRKTTTLVPPALSVDSQRAAVELVKRRVGVARVNAFFVKEALEARELVEWLPEARTREGVFAVWPRSRRPVRAAKTLVDALAAEAARSGLLDT